MKTRNIRTSVKPSPMPSVLKRHNRGYRIGVRMTAGCVLALFAFGGAGAIELAPHRAVYDMRLASAIQSSGITNVEGAMSYRFTDTCDGWTSETRTVIRISYDSGTEVESAWSFVNWESRDGRRYRFRLKHVRDGHMVESTQGTASLQPGDGGGMAHFSLPEKRDITLPPGTMFPTRHLRALLSAAVGGKRILSRPMFDGSNLNNPYEVNALIGKVVQEHRSETAINAGMADRPEWLIRMAFFAIASKEPEPEFEIGVRYGDDGTADLVFQDFGAFQMNLTISEFEYLPKTDC